MKFEEPLQVLDIICLLCHYLFGWDQRPRFKPYTKDTQIVLKQALTDSMHLHRGHISNRLSQLERGGEAVPLAILLIVTVACYITEQRGHC